jgi:hypothetical protein
MNRGDSVSGRDVEGLFNLKNVKRLFGRAPAPQKMAPALLVEWLLCWSCCRFSKRLAKRLHQLD